MGSMPGAVCKPHYLLLFFFCFSAFFCQAQEIPKCGFAIFSLVPKNLSVRVSVATNCLFQTSKEDSVGLGTYTGVLPWKPETGSLVLEAKGYPPLEKKPFLKTGETPLLVLKEVSSGTLDFLVVPNAKSRGPSFYDAINLSDQASLTIQANQKDVELPQGTRVRLTTEKALRYACGRSVFEPISPDENGNFLLIFYTDATKMIRCMVTRDDLL